MLERIHRQFGTAGLVVAVVALVAALGGGAVAATGGGPLAASSAKKSAGLTSKQVKEVEKLAKKFQGTGPAGPQGQPGPKGDPGSKGEVGSRGEIGPAGPLLKTLASGDSVSGAWAVRFSTHDALVSYPFGLPAPIAKAKIIYLEEGEGETTECPGTAEEPEAAKGYLCLYTVLGEELAPVVQNPVFPGSFSNGALVEFEGEGFGYGSWAVTAE